MHTFAPKQQTAEPASGRLARPGMAHREAPTLQRAGVAPAGARAASAPMMQQALGSTGQPLDSAVRNYMEPRFGHDFSQVRLHADTAAHASAAAEGAMAYATGHDVVFGAGQYQPHTVAGRWLIAHELAHVVQQRGAVTEHADSGSLERQAEDVGMRVVLGGHANVAAASGPAVQYLKVSSGGFGKALEDYTTRHNVTDNAIRLLQTSPSFMKLAAALDGHYVWLHDPAFPSLAVDANGNVTTPKGLSGKRALIVTGGGGARFVAKGSSPAATLGADFIALDDSPETPGFIQLIAHEATHAAAFVGAAAPGPQTLLQEINAGIKDEIHARQSEGKILGEVAKAGKGHPAVAARIGTVGSTQPWKVQRDFSPGLGVTYLESFFFERELRDAQAAEKLDEAATRKIREELDALVGTRVAKPRTHYGQVWFDWQTVAHYWRLFNQAHDPGDSDFEVEKEKELQSHAKWYFKGKVAYLPKP